MSFHDEGSLLSRLGSRAFRAFHRGPITRGTAGPPTTPRRPSDRPPRSPACPPRRSSAPASPRHPSLAKGSFAPDAQRLHVRPERLLGNLPTTCPSLFPLVQEHDVRDAVHAVLVHLSSPLGVVDVEHTKLTRSPNLAPRRTRWGRTPCTPRTSPRRTPRRWGGRSRARRRAGWRRVRATRASGRRRGTWPRRAPRRGRIRAREGLAPDAGSSGGEGGAGTGAGSRAASGPARRRAARGARRRGRRGAGPRNRDRRGMIRRVPRSIDARGWTRGCGGAASANMSKSARGPSRSPRPGGAGRYARARSGSPVGDDVEEDKRAGERNLTEAGRGRLGCPAAQSPVAVTFLGTLDS